MGFGRQLLTRTGFSSLLAGLLVAVGVLAVADNSSVKKTPPAARQPSKKPSASSRVAVKKSSSPAEVARTPETPSVPLSRMVGQMVMAGMNGTIPDEALLARVRAGQVGGVILFGPNVAPGLPQAIGTLQEAAKQGHNPPLLISVDQEGGTVRRFAGPPISPRAVASRQTALAQGVATAGLLRSQGVNVDLAPVADVTTSGRAFEFQQQRGFNGSPDQVAELAGAFATGLQRNDVAATAKHFPGLGSLTVDTDNQVGDVSLSSAALNDALTPFRGLIEDHIDLMMVASAAYPALDRSGAPADLSRRIMHTLLRDKLHFSGVTITDALDTPTDLAGSYGQRAVRAAKAGADIVLFAPEEAGPSAYAALLAAAADHDIPISYIHDAYARITKLKAKLVKGL